MPDGEQPPYSLVPGVRDSPCIPVWEESVLAQSVFPVPSHVPEDPHSPPTPRGQLEQCYPSAPGRTGAFLICLSPGHLGSPISHPRPLFKVPALLGRSPGPELLFHKVTQSELGPQLDAWHMMAQTSWLQPQAPITHCSPSCRLCQFVTTSRKESLSQ